MPDEKKQPNILIIWGDDIGWFNVSMNNNGVTQALEKARQAQAVMATSGGAGVK